MFCAFRRECKTNFLPLSLSLSRCVFPIIERARGRSFEHSRASHRGASLLTARCADRSESPSPLSRVISSAYFGAKFSSTREPRQNVRIDAASTILRERAHNFRLTRVRRGRRPRRPPEGKARYQNGRVVCDRPVFPCDIHLPHSRACTRRANIALVAVTAIVVAVVVGPPSFWSPLFDTIHERSSPATSTHAPCLRECA